MEIQVIDHYTTFGNFIDREKNLTSGVLQTNSRLTKNHGSNFRSYMPASDYLGSDITMLYMNL